MNTYCLLDEAYSTPKDIEMLARSNYLNVYPDCGTQDYQPMTEYQESDFIDSDVMHGVDDNKKQGTIKHDTSIAHLESCKRCRHKVRKLLNSKDSNDNKHDQQQSGVVVNGEEIKEMLVMILVAVLLFRLLDKVI
jgi:hypothetical protein